MNKDIVVDDTIETMHWNFGFVSKVQLEFIKLGLQSIRFDYSELEEALDLKKMIAALEENIGVKK